MNWLNYHHLFYFRTIASEGSIAKAAEKLRLGQPTLSTQLRQLEDALGQTLFERRSRKLFLTDAGRIALEYANEIFRMGSEMTEALSDRISHSKVHLQIGALDSVPKHFVIQLTQKAFKAGNCRVTILEGRGDELFRELVAHKIDLILSNYPPQAGISGGVYAKSIAKLKVIICGSEKYKSLKKGFPKSLDGKPFILPTIHSKLRYDLDHYFKTHSIMVDPVAESQDTVVQKLLGTSGIGLIALPEEEAHDLLEQKKLVKIGTLQNVIEEIWLISATRKIENPIAEKLMGMS